MTANPTLAEKVEAFQNLLVSIATGNGVTAMEYENGRAELVHDLQDRLPRFVRVEGLGALRNKLGDAHGKGKTEAQPEPRHAELAVNLAGATSTFLVQSWELTK